MRSKSSTVEAGQRFGRWTALRECGRNRLDKVLWCCRCDCGNEREVQRAHLLSGRSTSCGCSRRAAKTHGATVGGWETPEHNSWRAMWERCSNPNHASYPDYGGRGIVVCLRWASYVLFYADMGPKPTARHSIERLDTHGNYEPDNCIWALPKAQARNRRDNMMVTAFGQTKLLCEWAEERGLRYGQVYDRIKKLGWPPEQALTPGKHLRSDAGKRRGQGS